MYQGAMYISPALIVCVQKQVELSEPADQTLLYLNKKKTSAAPSSDGNECFLQRPE